MNESSSNERRGDTPPVESNAFKQDLKTGLQLGAFREKEGQEPRLVTIDPIPRALSFDIDHVSDHVRLTVADLNYFIDELIADRGSGRNTGAAFYILACDAIAAKSYPVNRCHPSPQK